MSMDNSKLSSIAERALRFLKQVESQGCQRLRHGQACGACYPCKAHAILNGEDASPPSARSEYICPECDIGHHERCSSAHCECDCP